MDHKRRGRPFDHHTVRGGESSNVSDKSDRRVNSGGNGRRIVHDKRVPDPTHHGRGRQSTSERGVVSNSTTNDHLAPAANSVAAREAQEFSMHSFRSGGRFHEHVQGKMYKPQCRERFTRAQKWHGGS